ncbi:MAG: hypothetical protein ACREXY_17775, partial [Gammaproteobacteria bacterium]
MNYHVGLVLFSMLFSLPPYSTPAADELTKADTRSQPKNGKAHAVREHGVSLAGQPGKASRVTRTIRMQTLDTMRYAPE